MPVLDHIIGAVSPERALRREASRQVLNSLSGGVSRDVGKDSYAPSSLSYKASEREGRLRGTPRDRCRVADVKSMVGRAIVDRKVDNVIGRGMTLRPQTGAEDFDREASERFAAWIETAEITGMYPGPELQRVFYRNTLRDGACSLALLDINGEPKLQLILDDLIGQNLVTAGGIYEGVEVSRYGRPLALHVGNAVDTPSVRVRIRDAVWMPHDLRPGSWRGRPLLYPVLDDLARLDEYVDAVVTCARMAAVFGLIFRSNSPGDQLSNLPLLQQQGPGGEDKRAVTLQNGMVRYVGSRDDVAQVQPQQPMQQTPDFISCLMRLIGNAVNMPLEIVALDFSRVNFHSARASFQQFYRHCRTEQQRFGGPNGLGKVYRWWVARSVAAGVFTSPVPNNFMAHEWRGDEWPSVKRLEDLQASHLACEIGLSSPQREADALNLDFAKLVAEREEAQRMNVDAGLLTPESNHTRPPTPEEAGQNADEE